MEVCRELQAAQGKVASWSAVCGTDTVLLHALVWLICLDVPKTLVQQSHCSWLMSFSSAAHLTMTGSSAIGVRSGHVVCTVLPTLVYQRIWG